MAATTIPNACLYVCLVWCAVSIGEVVNDGNAVDDLPPECTPEYQALEGHTMCLHDSDDVITAGVSRGDRRKILRLHNKLRSKVSPAATDMPKMKWDKSLAAVAQKWSQQCNFGHDTNREIPSYGLIIGQNAAMGQSSWEDAVMAWYNEVSLFRYGEDPEVYLAPQGWSAIGHYTQVVQSSSVRVGCGFAHCQGASNNKIYVCNYASGQTKISQPYAKGDKRCSDCPNTCKKGLCDCRGKLCRNLGTLDLNTCKCSCKDRYKGSSCQTYVPPKTYVSSHNCTFVGDRPSTKQCREYGNQGADSVHCQSINPAASFGCDACTQYDNIKTQYCPVMCAYCADPNE